MPAVLDPPQAPPRGHAPHTGRCPECGAQQPSLPLREQEQRAQVWVPPGHSLVPSGISGAHSPSSLSGSSGPDAGSWGQEALLTQLVGGGGQTDREGWSESGRREAVPQPRGQEGWGSQAPAGPIPHPLQMDRPRGLRPLPATCMACTGSVGSTHEA